MDIHGLGDEQIRIIRQVLYPFADKIKSVGLFGSRAKGTYRANSDIDMVIYGSISEKEVDRLYTLFEESLLHMKVDVIAYHLIKYPPLKAQIDVGMYPLLLQKDLYQLR